MQKTGTSITLEIKSQIKHIALSYSLFVVNRQFASGSHSMHTIYYIVKNNIYCIFFVLLWPHLAIQKWWMDDMLFSRSGAAQWNPPSEST